MSDNFSTYHPVVNLIYFVFVIGVSMFLTHPVFLGISLLCAILYNAWLVGIKKTLKNNLLFTLPMVILVGVSNPLFNHYGVTILFYLNNGNPVTLETMVYGVVMAIMLCEVVLWFACYNRVMTSDKFIYLFGRVIPALSLILSMCLRFVPRFIERMHIISNGQKCIGRDVSNGNVIQKCKHGITILSILVTWALENAIETADSMKSRGYGLKGRTAFSIYRMDRRDKWMLVVMAVLAGIFFMGTKQGYTYFQYDPKIKVEGLPLTPQSAVIFASYLIFCLLPIIVNVANEYRWKVLRSQSGAKEKGDYRLWV
jgi:energy-coupling factor transport system permease protein